LNEANAESRSSEDRSLEDIVDELLEEKVLLRGCEFPLSSILVEICGALLGNLYRVAPGRYDEVAEICKKQSTTLAEKNIVVSALSYDLGDGVHNVEFVEGHFALISSIINAVTVRNGALVIEYADDGTGRH